MPSSEHHHRLLDAAHDGIPVWVDGEKRYIRAAVSTDLSGESWFSVGLEAEQATFKTADAGRYGEAIPVLVQSQTSAFDRRYYVRSATATVGDVDPGAYDTERHLTLGWIIKDKSRWLVVAADFAANRSTDVFSCSGRQIDDCSTLKDAIDSIVWHVACRGRTWLVSEVR